MKLARTRKMGTAAIPAAAPIALVVSLTSPVDAAQLGDRQLYPPGSSIVPSADFDADGDADYLIYSPTASGEPRLDWIENQGAGPNGPHRPVASPAITFDQVVDMDGDGDPDFYEAEGTSAFWYENLGGGLAGPRQLARVFGSSLSSFAGDFDGDGDADIVAADYASDEIVLSLNNGGVFAAPISIGATGYLPSQVGGFDADMDGDLDVVWVSDWQQNRPEDTVVWFSNDGGGAFGATTRTIISPGSEDFGTLITVDVDGDGDSDVVTGSFGSLDICLINDGTGQFSSYPFPTVSAVRSFADVDGDGDQDILTVAGAGGVETLVWHEHVAGLGFRPFTYGLTTDVVDVEMASIGAFDAEGDGDDDVFLVTSSASPNGWHENRLCGEVGTVICDPAELNSTGTFGKLTAQGTIRRQERLLTLTAVDLPTNAPGIFVVSRAEGFSVMPGGSQGNLCLSGSIGRYVGPGQIQNSGANGEMQLAVDFLAIPQPNGPVPITIGDTWWFQAWHRDANPSATSNFTTAVGVEFFQ